MAKAWAGPCGDTEPEPTLPRGRLTERHGLMDRLRNKSKEAALGDQAWRTGTGVPRESRATLRGVPWPETLGRTDPGGKE